VTTGLDFDVRLHEPAIEEPETTHGFAESRQVGARRLVGVALSGLGILLALVVLYLYAFTPLTARRDQHRLLNELAADPLSTFALTNGVAPPEGKPVAVLEIPVLHLSQAVVEGTSAADLEGGPGLMPGTAIPGAAGNSVIAGRRLTFGRPFASIGSLHIGARVRVTDGLGTFRYRVTSLRTVTSGERDVVSNTADDRLTLVTSDSSFVPTGREVVVAKLLGRAVAPQVLKPIPAGQRGLTGDAGAVWQVLLWSALLLLVAIFAGYAAWRWRRPWPTYVLAVPVLVACGLFAAEAVARCLPATL
jgi:sortase A